MSTKFKIVTQYLQLNLIYNFINKFRQFYSQKKKKKLPRIFQ